MTNSYNRERGEEDVNDNGEHMAIFKHAAAAHGLEMNGYRLTTDAAEKVREVIDKWERAQSWKLNDF